MEPVEAFFDEESRGMLSSDQDAYFMLHLLDHDSFSNHTNHVFSFEIPQDFVPNDENVASVLDESILFSSDTTLTNLYRNSQESCSELSPYEDNSDNLFHVINREFESFDQRFPVFPDDLMEETLIYMKEEKGTNQLGNAERQTSATDDSMQLKRKFNPLEIQNGAEEDNSSENPNKRTHLVSRDATKNKRSKDSKSKKNKKLIRNSNDEEDTYNARGNGQSSSSWSIEDDSNGSQESNEETSESQGLATINSNGKRRASRGSATDPQSIYARVDISTMLEEAVHYVKFLQLQIKLLSSDDLWMFASIADNGMDIDLHGKISPSI
ncbi:unnamed protein product [Fraxinus pennsylvanica]|uniref:Uncharacterized protein n=1 Tax=Fraxinus pennsylvanica TaxID=56036 RepID=A0AAD1YLU9_9LAMI|nr:unnamed protein product [Fraxinus pennsylvanica]